MSANPTWLWPPRPLRAIPPSLIKVFEDKGWVGQPKMNGTCEVVFVDKFGNTTFKTRHNESNRAWTPDPKMVAYFGRFPDSVFTGELLHNKSPLVKNTLVLFDVLRYLGESMVGKTLDERLTLLAKLQTPISNVQVIKTHTRDLTGLYNDLPNDGLFEGVVLKDPKAKLRECLRDGLNAGWQVKARRPTKNYSF